MYTDTKNLANLCVNNTNASTKMLNHQQQEQSDKFKLKKVWKPILRLISLKSASAAKNNRSVPNNVNLNNANNSNINNTPKDLLFGSEVEEEEDEQCTHTPTTHITTAPTQKLPEIWHQTQAAAEPTASTKQPLEFISRVSVDKTPINTCNNCAYGRNCQHSQYHQMDNSAHHNTASPLPQDDLNFINAEDGCFVWSDSSGDIDEQLLRQWFWQNSWQFAENATMC